MNLELMTIDNMKSFEEMRMSTKDIQRITGKRHYDIMRDIKRIAEEVIIENDNYHSQDYYTESKYQGERREEKMLILTARGVNQILSSYSAVYRDLIYDYVVFLENKNKELSQEKKLLVDARDFGKYDRKKFTDTIAELKNYADEYRMKHEGKGEYKRIYQTYTREVVRVVNSQFGRDGNKRDELESLAKFENASCRSILVAMKKGIHYKDIYKLWKQELQDIVEFG